MEKNLDKRPLTGIFAVGYGLLVFGPCLLAILLDQQARTTPDLHVVARVFGMLSFNIFAMQFVLSTSQIAVRVVEAIGAVAIVYSSFTSRWRLLQPFRL